MAQKKQQPRRRTGPATAPGKRKSCHFCRDKVKEIDYKNLRSSAATSRRREDPLAPHHGRLPEAPDPGRLGGEAGARWLSFRTSASHGSHPPSGRREARPAR